MMTDSERFIADGHDRSRLVNEPAIREQVESEFAAELADANWFQRWKIRRRIKEQVRRRCDELAPPDALY